MHASPRDPRVVMATVVVFGAQGGTSALDTLVAWLDHPTVAFVLLVLGIASVTIEVAHPGIVGTGVAGVLLILAGLWSLSLQPVRPAGLALIVLAAGLYIAELFAPSAGIAAILGSIALAIGGLLLIDDPASGGVPAEVVLPVTILVGVGAIVAGRLALRMRHVPSTMTGAERFLGRDLVVARTAGMTGQAFVDGAWWQVRSTGTPLEPDMPARVVAVDGLVLTVDPWPRRPPPADPRPGDPRQKETP